MKRKVLRIGMLITIILLLIVSYVPISITNSMDFLSIGTKIVYANPDIVLTGLGVNVNKGVAAPAITGVNLLVNDFIIVVGVGDSLTGSQPVITGAGAGGGTLTLTEDISINLGGQVSAQVWSGKVLTAKNPANIQSNYNGAQANGISAYKATGLSDSPFDKGSTNSGSGANATAGPTATLSQADELCIAVTGVEDEVDDAHGTFTTGATYISGNEQFGATNGGGDTSNIQIHSVAEIVAATTAQNVADNGHDSSGWVAAIATYKMAPAFNVDIDTNTENLGTVAPNTTYYAFGSAPSNPVQDAECTFILTNNGIDCDIDVQGANFTGGVGWTLGAPAQNQVRITVYYSGQNPASGVVVTTSAQEFYDHLVAAAHIHLDFKFESATSHTDGVAKSGVLTFTAVAED